LKIALYRMYYGADWLRASVESVLSWADKVFIFYTDQPWGNTVIPYKGEMLTIPVEPIDKAVSEVLDLQNDYPNIVRRYYDHVPDPMNQFTHLVNDRIDETVDEVMIIEVDQVWCEDRLAQAIEGWERRDGTQISLLIPQIEIWRPPGVEEFWMVPHRPNRTGIVMWDLRSTGGKMPPTKRQGEPLSKSWQSFLGGDCLSVHNMGFAISQEAMFVKHLAAIGFSKKIGDSQPNEDWFEEKWLNWTPETTNLEISKGFEHHIPKVVPYDLRRLPKAVLLNLMK